MNWERLIVVVLGLTVIVVISIALYTIRNVEGYFRGEDECSTDNPERDHATSGNTPENR